MKDAITRGQAHATFVIERTYPVPVEAVWHALSDSAARDQWFNAGDGRRPLVLDTRGQDQEPATA